MTTIEKIDRPPSAENWSRMQHPDVTKTARSIFTFVKGGPVWNYLPSRKATKFHIEDGIDRAMAVKIASRHGSALGRSFNVELVHAFFDFVEQNPIPGVRAFDELVEWFPLRRGVAIPIKPLAVVRQDGQFTPIMLCPWSNIAFNEYQASLFMTVLEKALFTLTDFQDSQGLVLFFPTCEVSPRVWQRKPTIWRRGDVPLLNDADLNDQIRIFFESRELARVWYQDFLDHQPKR